MRYALASPHEFNNLPDNVQKGYMQIAQPVMVHVENVKLINH